MTTTIRYAVREHVFKGRLICQTWFPTESEAMTHFDERKGDPQVDTLTVTRIEETVLHTHGRPARPPHPADVLDFPRVPREVRK